MLFAMAGHSKWANIRHRKERADAKKGKLFTRAAKEIISAVKLGGPDVRSNVRLRLAIQKARAVNFPNESIERNIKKGCSADQQDYAEITYELYGHGGMGLIVEVMTDNKNRAASEMRIAVNKAGGTIAAPGAVAFNYDRRGWIEVAQTEIDEDRLFLTVTEAGAEDFVEEAGHFVVITPVEQLFAVKEAIEAIGYACPVAELRHLPRTMIAVDEETAQANFALIERLEAIDDVDAVYHNMTLPG
jgi:YebC/PmpR family DNA-binding regulatory protein